MGVGSLHDALIDAQRQPTAASSNTEDPSIAALRRMAQRGQSQQGAKRVATSPVASPEPKRKNEPKAPAPVVVPQPLPGQDAMDVDLSSGFDFKSLWDPQNITHFAMQVNDNDIIGHPMENPLGMEFVTRIDPGSKGTPSLEMTFRFSKDGQPSTQADHFHEVKVDYEPGVKIDDLWMLQSMEVYRASAPPNEKFLALTLPPAIKRMVPEKEDQDKLFHLSFHANVHRATPYDPDWLTHLRVPEEEYDAITGNMKSLFEDTGKYTVQLWFIDRKANFERGQGQAFIDGCLKPLVDAVTIHLRPHHQYRNEYGRPVVELDTTPINQIGNAMYEMHKKRRNAQGELLPSSSEDKVSYYRFQKRLHWEDLGHLQIYHGIPIGRELQYQQGQSALMEQDFQVAYIEQLPTLYVRGETIQPDRNLWQNSFYVGIRTKRNPDGTKPGNVPEGAIVKLDWFNGDENRAHRSNPRTFWVGKVQPHSGAWLKATNCDFCVLASRPRGDKSSFKAWKPHRKQLVPDANLQKVKVMVHVNPTTAKRELSALKMFCDWDFHPDTMNDLRMAFMSDPNRAQPKSDEYIDLTYGPQGQHSEENKKLWDQMMATLAEGRKDNPSQMRILRCPGRMRKRVTAIRGPPGVGKTRTLKDMIICLTKIGHKSLCVASSNNAVDHLARQVYEALGPDGRSQYKCLRLNSDGAEKVARLAKVNYAAYEPGSDLGKPEYRQALDSIQQTGMKSVLDRIAAEMGERETTMTSEKQKDKFAAQAEKMTREYDAVNDTYKRLQRETNIRQSDVPNGMTLDYRIWELCEEDLVAAQAEYDEARSSMSPQVFDRQVASGEISLVHFNKSGQYRFLVSQYIQTRGKLDKAQNDKLQEEMDKMVLRVLKATHLLFTTSSNAAGDLLTIQEDSFRPTILLCDEAGQISLPSLCVPLTNFPNVEGVFLVGDTQQLEPTVQSTLYNEFLHNARLSPLALLIEKGYPSLLLDTTYRLPPSLAQFPNQKFYDGDLHIHDSAKIDTDNRKAVRAFSLEWCKLKNSNNLLGEPGSEYVFLDVMWGASQVEVNGKSLVNFANAHADLEVVREMLKRKVKPSDIKILAYYSGQQRLLRQRINEDQGFPEDVKRQLEVSTVDAFQGRERQTRRFLRRKWTRLITGLRSTSVLTESQATFEAPIDSTSDSPGVSQDV